MASTFGERFKMLRLETGLKQEEFIKDFNKKFHYSFTRAAVSQYENNKRIPEISALKDFAEYFNVSVDFLLGNSDIKKSSDLVSNLFAGPGRLSGLINKINNNTPNPLFGSNNLNQQLPSNVIHINEKLVKIPVIGVIRAGMPILAQENIEGWEYIEESEVKGGDYFYLRVKGDSMVGARIMDGDLVLIRKQPDVEHGEIAAVRVNGDEATLKRVLKVDNAIILQPENHSYHPRLCTHEELISGYVEIIGKVIEVKFKL